MTTATAIQKALDNFTRPRSSQYFERAYVLNLPFKSDRLQRFESTVPPIFGNVEVWPAVHGDSIRHPTWWTSGSGAWGCYRSHLQILEHCYQQRIESYIVFEDDAIFRQPFDDDFQAFWDELPDDWEMIYLGGQLLHEIAHPPKRISEHVYAPYNVNRTHCLAVHSRGYEKLYRHLHERMIPGDHIDHHLGRLHESENLRIYCPHKWIVGQADGHSNISGQNNPVYFWTDPERIADRKNWRHAVPPVVFLEAPISVAVELDSRGWHRGHWRNHENLDHGLVKAMESENPADCTKEILAWYKIVLREAIEQGKECVCLYHPRLTWGCVKSLGFRDILRVQTQTAIEAEGILNTHTATAHMQPDLTPVRHLIYHIYPRRENGVWQWNVQELLKRIECFDGSRVVAVVTDGTTDSLEAVQQAFGETRIDRWIVEQNSPGLGEVKTFRQLLDCVPMDPLSAVFYGHAKGVRYDMQHTNIDWARSLYEICLDDLPYVDSLLSQFDFVGPYKRTHVDHGRSDWHYSGNFFWFRPARVLCLPGWDQIHQDYYGAEQWAGSFVDVDRAGCLFGEGGEHLWQPGDMSRMREQLDKWMSERRNRSENSV